MQAPPDDETAPLRTLARYVGEVSTERNIVNCGAGSPLFHAPTISATAWAASLGMSDCRKTGVPVKRNGRCIGSAAGLPLQPPFRACGEVSGAHAREALVDDAVGRKPRVERLRRGVHVWAVARDDEPREGVVELLVCSTRERNTCEQAPALMRLKTHSHQREFHAAQPAVPSGSPEMDLRACAKSIVAAEGEGRTRMQLAPLGAAQEGERRTVVVARPRVPRDEHVNAGVRLVVEDVEDRREALGEVRVDRPAERDGPAVGVLPEAEQLRGALCCEFTPRPPTPLRALACE